MNTIAEQVDSMSKVLSGQVKLSQHCRKIFSFAMKLFPQLVLLFSDLPLAVGAVLTLLDMSDAEKDEARRRGADYLAEFHVAAPDNRQEVLAKLPVSEKELARRLRKAGLPQVAKAGMHAEFRGFTNDEALRESVEAVGGVWIVISQIAEKELNAVSETAIATWPVAPQPDPSTLPNDNGGDSPNPFGDGQDAPKSGNESGLMEGNLVNAAATPGLTEVRRTWSGFDHVRAAGRAAKMGLSKEGRAAYIESEKAKFILPANPRDAAEA